MIEVEKKFRLTDEQYTEIEQQLSEKHVLGQPFGQTDEVYLKGIPSFSEFEQGMPVLRIRTEDNMSTLTYKRAINAGGDAIEHETEIGSVDAMRRIVADMGFSQVTSVVKTRREATIGRFTLALDKVKQLGAFLEIEAITDDPTTVEVLGREIVELATTFGLTEAHIEPKKYDQLIAQLKST